MVSLQRNDALEKSHGDMARSATRVVSA